MCRSLERAAAGADALYLSPFQVRAFNEKGTATDLLWSLFSDVLIRLN